MVLLPKEHGAYGQLTLPVVTALTVAGLSTAGLFLTVSAIAGFVAHEPASVLLGLRGPRAKREVGRAATWWLAVCAGIAIVAGVIALITMERDGRWSIAVPIVPAVLLGIAVVRGREKSWYGELAAACAFAGLSVPLSIAGGTSLTTAISVAVPFALLFVASTLAVRIVILRVRGGGDPSATSATRIAAFTLTGVAAGCLGWLIAIDVLRAATLVAATPGLLTAVLIAARPPQPTRLRSIGWTLVGVSLITAVIIIVTV